MGSRLRGWLSLGARKRIVFPLCRQLYRDNNPDASRSILVAGAARSGTTWVAEILASDGRCRIMFEPFQSRLVEQFSNFNYFQYMRPGAEDDELVSYSKTVFTGAIRHRWIDRQVNVILPEWRLVKDIRVNLFLRWLSLRFPEVPIAFVVRHPCAVVLSRLGLGWDTDRDIAHFLEQPDLVADHLADHIDLICRLETPEEKHAVVWCISNLVPLRQFPRGTLNLFHFEDLVNHPDTEIPRLFQSLGRSPVEATSARLDRPSATTTGRSAAMTGANRVTSWKKTLAPRQVDRILAVVSAFGMDELYDDAGLPRASRTRFSRDSKERPVTLSEGP